MKSRYRHRVLIVEDDARWADLMAKAAERYEGEIDFHFVRNYDQAIGILYWTRFHLVSIDQNIASSEGGLVLPDHGFELCEWLARWQPLVERRFYTANGEKEFVRRAYKDTQTDYFEKKTEDNQNGAFDIPEYLADIATHLKADHLQWFLRKAKNQLPPLLATPAAIFGKKLRDSDLMAAFTEVSHVWERSLWMAWAQACALAARAGEIDALRTLVASNKVADVERSLGTLFPVLWKNGHLAAWHKFINGDAATVQSGRPFLEASARFRLVRNDVVHGKKKEISHLDMEEITPDILTIFDAAAFWSEYPLLLRPHFHSHKPGVVAATRISGSKPWSELQFAFHAHMPDATLRNHIFMPYYVAVNFERFEQIFLDLFPLVMMEDVSGEGPHPVLTHPRGKQGYERISLEDGAKCVIPLSPAACAAISAMFGKAWTPK